MANVKKFFHGINKANFSWQKERYFFMGKRNFRLRKKRDFFCLEKSLKVKEIIFIQTSCFENKKIFSCGKKILYNC